MKKLPLFLIFIAIIISLISCTSGDIANIPEKLISISTNYDTDTQMEEYLEDNKKIIVLKEKTDEGEFEERWKRIITNDLENNPVNEEYYRYNEVYLNKTYEYDNQQVGLRNNKRLTETVFKDSNGVVSEKETYEYDNNNRLTKTNRISVYNGKQELLSYYVYEYSDEGTNPTKISYFIPGEEPLPRSYHEITYNEENKKEEDTLVHITQTNSYAVHSKNVYRYNEEGLLDKDEYYEYHNENDTFHLEWIAEYSYQEGKLVKIEKRNTNGHLVAKKVY